MLSLNISSSLKTFIENFKTNVNIINPYLLCIFLKYVLKRSYLWDNSKAIQPLNFQVTKPCHQRQQSLKLDKIQDQQKIKMSTVIWKSSSSLQVPGTLYFTLQLATFILFLYFSNCHVKKHKGHLNI